MLTASLDQLRDGLQAALAHPQSLPFLFLALVLTTFLLEDVAIAVGMALALDGVVSWWFAFASVAGGIALGDLGLYGLGRLCLRWDWVRSKLQEPVVSRIRRNIDGRLAQVILVARVIPGLRLVSYLACGYLRIPFVTFSMWVLISVSLWTIGLFFLGTAVGEELSDWTGLPVSLAAMIPVLLVVLILPKIKKWLS